MKWDKSIAGDAFFAAFGERSSEQTGERESVSFNKNYSFGIEGPAPYYIGFSQGISEQNETYFMKNRTSMNAAFWRDYTDIKRIKMEYNKLSLRVKAKVQDCVALMSKTDRPIQYHICDDQERYREISEEWYFIGDIESDKNSVIADGMRPGDTDKTQIIRGKVNFDRMWGQIEGEDAAIAVRRSRDVYPDAAFHNYLKKGRSLPYEKLCGSLISWAGYTSCTRAPLRHLTAVIRVHNLFT